MSKRAMVLTVAMTLVVATLALAGNGRGPGNGQGQGQGPGMAAGPGGAGDRDWLINYLGLTEAQVVQWEAIQEATHAQVLPLAEQRQANREAIRTQLEGGAPNAQTLGELMIANYGIGQQVEAIREGAHVQFMALLTDEQKAKFEEFLEMVKSRPRRGGHGAGDGSGPIGGGGFGFGPGNGSGPGDGSCFD